MYGVVQVRSYSMAAKLILQNIILNYSEAWRDVVRSDCDQRQRVRWGGIMPKLNRTHEVYPNRTKLTMHTIHLWPN